MPVQTDPGTGMQIRWTSRQVVTITASIPVKGSSGQDFFLPLRVRFSRRALAAAVRRSPKFLSVFPDRLRREILFGLSRLASIADRMPPPRGRAITTMIVPLEPLSFGRLPFPVEVTIYRQPPATFQARGRPVTFSLLPRFLEASRVHDLDRMLSIWLDQFPPRIYLRPPRRGNRSRPLTRMLSVALFFAKDLLDQAEEGGDPDTQMRLRKILGEDQGMDGYGLCHAVLLVDRAFRGAWEKYGVARPLARKTPEGFQAQCAGSTPFRRFKDSLDMDPEWAKQTRQGWTKLLLEAPGQAARHFGLL